MADKFTAETIRDFVSTLDDQEFYQLKEAVSERISKELEPIDTESRQLQMNESCPVKERYKRLGINTNRINQRASKNFVRVRAGSGALYGG